MNRCGKCKNCVELDLVRRRVMACCNPPFSHADQGVVDLWNTELDRLPCLNTHTLEEEEGIEWEHLSSKDWVGETSSGHLYRIYEVRTMGFGGPNGLQNVVKKRHLEAIVERPVLPLRSVILGYPDEGRGAMRRLQKMCEQHYNDICAGKPWKMSGERLLPPTEET